VIYLKAAWILLIIGLIMVLPSVACAHQPRIVSGENTVEIKKPEVSQAFYGVLQGQPDEYSLTADTELDLYISILVPDIPDSRKDYTVLVSDPAGTQITSLNGTEHTWTEFFEPFVADNYLEGPEKEITLPAGQYRITVTNPDNRGKYVLSVGRDESFTLAETMQMIKRLPSVKRFFNKSPLTAYFNLVGLFMLLSLALIAAAFYGLFRLFRALA
jgi:hypothetical protein